MSKPALTRHQLIARATAASKRSDENFEYARKKANEADREKQRAALMGRIAETAIEALRGDWTAFVTDALIKGLKQQLKEASSDADPS